MTALDAMVAEVKRAPAGPQLGAFFDVDGTVIDGFSALAFYRHRARSFDIGLSEAARTLAFGLQRGEVSTERFAEFMALAIGSWAGSSEQEMEELGAKLFRTDIASTLFPEAWALICAHRARGHTIVLASSATRFQVRPLAEELGVEDVLCSPVQVHDGIVTGRLAGSPLWGAPKADAARELAAARDIDLESSFAYSNGYEDLPLLELVGRPRPLNPEPKLERVAQQRGWPARSFRPQGRPGVTDLARTAAAYGGLFAGFGVGFGLGLLNGSRRHGVDLGMGLAGDLSLALAGVDVDVQYAERLAAHRPAVFIFNHQSPLDVPVLCKLLRGGFTGVAKREAAFSPVGPAFWAADVAFVDRRNSKQAREALEPAVQRLRRGMSLVIAPEGTRSISPRLGPFKKGGFHVARQAGVPVVPLVLRNTGAAMWRDAKVMRRATIDVYVHEPIDVGAWRPNQLDKRVKEVRQLYSDTLADWPAAGRNGHSS
ncbi:MAG: HAD-IB family hydrolase [Actinomycetota bacterium]|nr:HAD-IB family hydrolase [Actinomycetota bacterium]